MARVTVEDCVDKVPNRFELVMLAAHRAREIAAGSTVTVDRDNDKNPVVSLREIADETQSADELRERLIESNQNQIEVDEPEEDAMALLMGFAQFAVELRVINQVQPVDNFACQPTGPQYLNLCIDLGAIAREPANHGLQVHDAVFLGVQHHNRGGPIGRHSHAIGIVPRQQHENQCDSSDNQFAAPQRTNQRAKIDGVVIFVPGPGKVRLALVHHMHVVR